MNFGSEAAASRARKADATHSRAVTGYAVPAALVAITIVAATLRFYRLDAVESNAFYDAAVLSMGKSWHNFFFAAFEPGGSVSVDKPPLELWLQVCSVKLFGFNSLALKLPEALAGTLAVPLLFDLVRRIFGSGAGLASAAVLTILPVSVITARSDTMDSLMMMLLVLTAWLITMSATKQDWRYLVLAAAIVGVNFDVKLFEAMLPVPALALYFLLASGAPIRKRVAALGIAGLIALGVGLLWPIAISLAPDSQRPYALGSSDGTIWNSMFVFDGLKRLGVGSSSNAPSSWRNPRALTRMFQKNPRQLGEFVGATLLPAILFGIAALVLAGGEMLRGPPSAARTLRRAGVAMTIAWLTSVGAAMSVTSRLHPRYLEALTPAIAIALGVGVVWTTQASARRPWSATVAIALCTSLSVYFASTLHTTTALAVWIMAISATVAVAFALGQAIAKSSPRRGFAQTWWPTAFSVAVLVPLLVSPVAVSQRLVAASYSDSSYGPTDITRRQARQLSHFFAANRGHARYQAIVRTPSQASSLVVHNGLPLILLQNVGRAGLVTSAQIARAVQAGEVHYALLGSHCVRARPLCPAAAGWVRAHGRLLRRSIGLFAVGAARRQYPATNIPQFKR